MENALGTQPPDVAPGGHGAIQGEPFASLDSSPLGVAATRVAARAQAQAQARFLLLMDHSLDFLELVGRDGVIKGVSSAISALAGYAPGDLIGRSYRDLIHPDDCGLAVKTFATVLRDGRAGPVTLRYRRIDGSWRTIQATIRDYLEEPAARAIVVLTRDVTEQMQAESSLAAANSELHRLSQQLLLAQDGERAHLARELHDDIGQILVGLRLNMEANGVARCDSVPSTVVARWTGMVREVLEHLRQLTTGLRPMSLENRGLATALRALVDRLREASGRDIRVAISDDLGRLPPGIDVACFRIVQEALSNALKHSQASRISVNVNRLGNGVQIAVADNGKGFDVAEARARAGRCDSIGLLTMRERAALAGGLFTVESSPGHGTHVHATLGTREAVTPVPATAQACVE